jgi:hypothetical protein
VSAWTVESYTSIPPHLHSDSLPRILLIFGGVLPPDCLHKRRACSPKAGSEERERWATQLSLLRAKIVAPTQNNTVLLVEALQSPLRSSSFFCTVVLVLVDSSLAFAIKVSYILIVVYS